MQLPADEAQYDDYKLIAQGTLRNRSYTCDIFNFDAKSRIAKFMVLKNSSDATGYIAEEASLWVVTDIVKSYDADKNEESTQVTVTDGANIQTLTADTDICTLDGVKNPFGKTDSSGNEYTLSPGDLVRFELMNGKVVNIQIMYDADGKNPAWYGADPAAKTTDVPSGNENYTDVRGSIPGCTGFHHGPDNYSTYTNTNPFGYAYDIISGSKRVFGNTVFRSCYVYGFAYAEYENYMTISTQNLHGSFDGEIEKDNWYTETFNPAGADIVVVKGNGKRVSVKKGKISDIKTYEQAGTDCSKILVCHGYNYSTGRIFVFDN